MKLSVPEHYSESTAPSNVDELIKLLQTIPSGTNIGYVDFAPHRGAVVVVIDGGELTIGN